MLIPCIIGVYKQERVDEKDAKEHGVVVKSILALGESGDTPGAFEWNMHYPLYRLKLLTRPNGALKATTVSSGKVAKTRKFPKFYEVATKLATPTKAGELDDALVKKVHKMYCDNVAPRAKLLCNSEENKKRRHGRGSKYNNGRMHEPGSPVWEANIIFLREMVKENCFAHIMEKLKPEEVDMCMNVLRYAEIPDLDKWTEVHLMPTWCEDDIKAIVARLKPLVSREDVAAFSWGLAGMDAVMNAILRPQDLLGTIAAHVYMMTDRAPTGEVGDVLEAPLPPSYKNDEAMNRSEEGGGYCHIKDPRMHEWLVVMLVILRPLMREHLADWDGGDKGKKAELCDQIGPFDKDGKCFTPRQLQGYFQFIGKHLIALPHWGYNILRTASMTDTAFLALANNDAIDSPWVLRKLTACRMSKAQFNRHYNAVVPRALRANPNSIDSRTAGLDGLHRERAKLATGSSSGSSSEASQLELAKAKAEKDELALRIEKLEEEKAQVLREVETQRERIRQLEKENRDQPQPQSEPEPQPAPEPGPQSGPQPGPAPESESDETPGCTIDAVQCGVKRVSDDDDEQPREAKKAKSGGADGRKKPLDPALRELVKEMHECLKNMFDSVDRRKSYPLNSFEGAVRNIDSTSAPFAETTKAKMAFDHKELSDRFYSKFQGRGQLLRYYAELKIGVEK